MKSLICAASVAMMLVVGGMASRNTATAAADDPESISKIMSTLHKGKKAPMSVLKTALKSDTPDWAAVKKESEAYAKHSADMPKNDPPKGDAEAFKKLAKAYADFAKDLEGAAKKEDLAATQAAFKKISGSCKSCHEAHKED